MHTNILKSTQIYTIVTLIGTLLNPSAVQAANSLNTPLVPAFEAPPPQHTVATAASNCPTPPTPVLAWTAGSPYAVGDPTASIVSADKEARVLEQIKPVWNFAGTAALWANRYFSNPKANVSAGGCALHLLDGWASANALSKVEGHDSQYRRATIIAGLSMTFAQIQGLASESSVERQRIAEWLHRLALDMRSFYDALPPTSTVKLNNHRYWAGYGAAAAAIVTGDKDLLSWGTESFRVGVCAVNAAGALPLELRRGARALGYMFYAAGPLVMTDRIAARNGQDIHNRCNNGLDRLMTFSIQQALDPALINRLSGVAQQPVITSDGKLISRSSFAWLEAYQAPLAGFPKFQAAFQASRPFSSGEFGGNTTTLFMRH